jgi:hypothetical protein
MNEGKAVKKFISKAAFRYISRVIGDFLNAFQGQNCCFRVSEEGYMEGFPELLSVFREAAKKFPTKYHNNEISNNF